MCVRLPFVYQAYTDDVSQCCECNSPWHPRTFSHQNFTFCTRTLSVKDDHHKFRLEYYCGLPLVMRTSKPAGIKVKVKG